MAIFNTSESSTNNQEKKKKEAKTEKCIRCYNIIFIINYLYMYYLSEWECRLSCSDDNKMIAENEWRNEIGPSNKRAGEGGKQPCDSTTHVYNMNGIYTTTTMKNIGCIQTSQWESANTDFHTSQIQRKIKIEGKNQLKSMWIKSYATFQFNFFLLAVHVVVGVVGGVTGVVVETVALLWLHRQTNREKKNGKHQIPLLIILRAIYIFHSPKTYKRTRTTDLSRSSPFKMHNSMEYIHTHTHSHSIFIHSIQCCMKKASIAWVKTMSCSIAV